MRVLIACEYSGIMRDAFAERGHEAWSCDLIPTEKEGPHLLGDVRQFLGSCQANNFKHWDLMIAHPPCTYLSYAATAYWDQPGRIKKRIEALELFRTLWESDIEKICIENPLGIADAVITKRTQIIQPYYFGDSDLKRTCLWLKNLPKLKYTMEETLFESATAVDKPSPLYVDKSGKKRYFTESIGGGKRQGHKRSKSFEGIARAMADQWG